MLRDALRAADEIGEALVGAGDPARAEVEKRYLKSDLRHLGAGVPAIRKVAQRFAKEHPGVERDELLRLVDALWNEPIHEHRMAAVELLVAYGHLLQPVDLALVERLIRQAKTWALVDGLAATVAGGLVERFPALADELDRWADDEDFWLRRAALLALLVPLRRGQGDFDRFGRYADRMLEEREFFIRKAIGWVLRDTGRRRPDLVFEWLLPRASRASGVTIREAVKPLSERRRAEVLAAYRA